MALPGWGRYSGGRRPPAELFGRDSERGEIDTFLDAVRAGAGRALVLCGEPGVGKTTLLDHLVAQASGCRIARGAGVESEMELAYSTLHQLLTPLLHRLDRLSDPQRNALAIAFGLSAGMPPDRFLVGLATLSLLADVAEEHPLICVLDDEQWMDLASAQNSRPPPACPPSWYPPDSPTTRARCRCRSSSWVRLERGPAVADRVRV